MTKLNIEISDVEVADYYDTEPDSPTITLVTSDDHDNSFKWDVQTHHCKVNGQAGCIVFIDDEEYCDCDRGIVDSHYNEAIEYAEIFAAQHFAEQQQEKIKDSHNYDDIEFVAIKIKGILSSGDDIERFLSLASVLVNAESICINDTLILLQVGYGASQEQANQIINLF